MPSSDLKIRQIEAFRAVMQRHTVTRAAQMLHVSQPAVSRLLADFEAGVGFTLFERQQGRLMPTAEAHVLYEQVERTFVGLDRVTHAAQQIRAMRMGSLRVAGSPAVALELLPAVVAEFMRGHPGVEITVSTHGNVSTVVDLVAAGQCDVGFTTQATPHPDVRLERLTNAPMPCILPLGHRLADRERIHVTDLRDEPFVSFSRSFDVRSAVDRVFAEHDVHRKLMVEAQLSQIMVALVANGAGVALIDPLTAAYARTRVAVRPFDPGIEGQLYLATTSEGAMSGVAKIFAVSVRAALAEVLANASWLMKSTN